MVEWFMSALNSTIKDSFTRSFMLYNDLTNSLDEPSLDLKLPNLPSNTIGLQLWCVVGARESYAKAIEANEWSGFSCSLQKPNDKGSVLAALQSSETVVTDALENIDAYSDVQNQLAIDLLEHECQHHGQLIRYIYALKLDIPESWKQRYALS